MASRWENVKRRSRDEDEEEETPRRRSRYDEEEETPRRRRSQDDDERPRRARRSRGEDEDEEEAPRSRRRSRDSEDEDEDEDGLRGWKAYKAKRKEVSDFTNPMKLPTTPTLIKFLDAEPFAVFSEHWIQEHKGKHSFVCLEKDCPLCDFLGDNPTVYSTFNVLVYDEEDESWSHEFLKTRPRTTDQLEVFSDQRGTSPLNGEDVYFSIYKSGKKNNQQTNLAPVKARDIEEDFGAEPLDEKDIAKYKLYTRRDVVFENSIEELKTVAREADAA